MPHPTRIDQTDARILAILQIDGRRTYAEIGAEVGISGPSAHERVKKLEARGVIRGYAALVDPAAAGFDILAFSSVTQAPGTVADDLTGEFAAIPEIAACHHIAGAADYLLKIRARDTRDLERVLHRIQTTRNVFTTETDVVFSSAFDGRPIPLAGGPGVTGGAEERGGAEEHVDAAGRPAGPSATEERPAGPVGAEPAPRIRR